MALSSDSDSDVVTVVDFRGAGDGDSVLVLNQSMLFALTVSLDRWFQSTFVLGKKDFFCVCWMVLDAGTI